MSLEVLIVDDHSMVRKGVGMLIQEMGGEVAAEAASLEQARPLMRTSYWTLMVLDINLPDGDGLDFVQEIRADGYKQPILVHSLLPDSAVATRVFKAGANGFISKTCDPDDFIAACRRVEAGGRYVSPGYAEELASSLITGEPLARHDKLSEREFQVMLLIAQGKTPTQIAETLGCGVTSISTFRHRILKKLNLKTSLDIMRYALNHRLLTAA